VSRRRSGGRGGRRGPGAFRVAGITFAYDELRDLAAAWLALSLAFAILFAGGGRGMIARLGSDPRGAGLLVVLSLLTAGLGFMLHELAHKVVAVRFGQAAAFRANYQMLGLALMVSLAGFIFAAPGAVHHSGRITDRESGLIALAGPLANAALSVVFAAALFAGIAAENALLSNVGLYGLVLNLLLAGFNMLPFGPLDGATVRAWNTTVYVLVAVPLVAVGIWSFRLL
jgi:Zn-dependent protease